MQATIEQRVESLEKELAALKSASEARWLSPAVKKDWRSTFGWARNSPEFDRAMDSGAAYRKAQTYEMETGGPDAGA